MGRHRGRPSLKRISQWADRTSCPYRASYNWGYGREAAINPHKKQLRRFQEGRALQVELKQTVGVNVPIEERGQGPEVFRLEPRPESLPVDRPLNYDRVDEHQAVLQ